MTIQEMNERKKELGYSNEQLAQMSGVPLETIQKVLSGTIGSPGYDTLRKLEKVLGAGDSPARDRRPESAQVLREAVAYGAKKQKQQGEYTLEDYYALPDERRVELIDGVFYDMSAPTGAHQAIIGLLYMSFASFVRSRGGSCKVFLSPYDVQLDEDDRTMVQPDLVVICRRDRILMRCCFGAPDLAIEVLSPSTRKKDIRIKTAKYENAGVREYWMIDPDNRQVMVIDFTKEKLPAIYGFDAKVPVGIWDGELEIDFGEISREIAYLYEADPVPEED